MKRGNGIEVDVSADALAAYAPVRADIRSRGRRFEAAAKARHAAHRDTGASVVDGWSGDIDYNIDLSDERGDLAALSIEFGTTGKPQRNEDGSWSATGTRGTFTLTGTPKSIAGGDSSA